jgi:hypothetical protein
MSQVEMTLGRIFERCRHSSLTLPPNNSMLQTSPSEANIPSVGKEIPRLLRNANSSVSIVLFYRLDPFPAGAGKGFLLLVLVSRPAALGLIQPPNQCVLGTLFLKAKRPGREADHSPPSSAEVKNAWSYTSTPQHFFMA